MPETLIPSIPLDKFPKIPRLSRDVIVTEKLDGTNSSILITEDGGFFTASRNRWITPEDDNYGFSKWAHQNKEELLGLGVGHHFGEWWGLGIARRYNVQEKRFSLFNTHRWGAGGQRPVCCHVVPVLYSGPFNIGIVDHVLSILAENGSAAAPGFMDAEGVIVYHTASRQMFKKTLKDDATGKDYAG